MLFIVIHEPKAGKVHLRTYVKLVEAKTKAEAIRTVLASQQAIYFEWDVDYTAPTAVEAMTGHFFQF